MRGWLGAFAILLMGSAVAAQAEIAIPLSPTDGVVTLALVCASDGTVGTYVDTAPTGSSRPGRVTLFGHADMLRAAIHFDPPGRIVPGVLPLPESWASRLPDSDRPGFLAASARLPASGEAGDLLTLERTLALRIPLTLMQIATSRYAGIEIGERRYVVPIDPSQLTTERVSACLEAAGLRPALAALRKRLAQPLNRTEVSALCVTLSNHNAALQALADSAPSGETGPGPVRHGVPARIDCYVPDRLDAAAIARAALEAADPTRLDYAAHGGVAGARMLSPEVYGVLRDDWGTRDLPGQREAEAAERTSENLAGMRRIYTQYARVVACNEALREARFEPASPALIDVVREQISALEGRVDQAAALDALWSATNLDFARVLEGLRRSAGASPSYTMDLCSNDVVKLQRSLRRMMAATSPPTRDLPTLSQALAPRVPGEATATTPERPFRPVAQ